MPTPDQAHRANLDLHEDTKKRLQSIEDKLDALIDLTLEKQKEEEKQS